MKTLLAVLFALCLIAPVFAIVEHTIDGDFGGAFTVYSADIDDDGDLDVLGAAADDDAITWWENDNGSGTSWTKRTIDSNFESATSIYAEDINNDGNIDILGAAFVGKEVAWWENINGSGTSWTKRTIDSNFTGAYSVYSADINNDGNMDVLGAAWVDDDIVWWESGPSIIIGSPPTWIKHIVDGSFDGATSVYAEDVDDDGDMDILGTAYYANDITWWENNDGSGTSWTEHTVDGNFDGARSVYSADLNDDGDIDILGAAGSDDAITWWENNLSSMPPWIKHTIDSNFDAAHSVYAGDIDNDGDLDVLGASVDDDDISWWENDDGDGTSWTEHLVDGNFDGAISVYSADIDGDDNLDILGAAAYDDDITWWDLEGAKVGVNHFELSEVTSLPVTVSALALSDPYPNPASDSLTVSYELVTNGAVSLHIYDLSGRLVETLVSGEQTAGRHSINGNASEAATGVYLLRLEAAGETITKRAVISR